MRYVTFDEDSGEIRSAVTGPEPSDPGPGLRIGDAGEVTFEGALKNYIFVADNAGVPGLLSGRVERKPKAEWDLAAEKEESDRQAAMMRFHQLDVTEIRRLELHMMVPARFERLSDPTTEYHFSFERTPIDVKLRHLEPIAINVGFDFGGYTVAF